jgi:hypothetical protein
MTKAIIYQYPKNVMQSGRGKTDLWVLEYDETVNRAPEPLNGWTSASNTTGQVQLKFESLDQARTFAQKQNLDFIVRVGSNRKVRPRNYVDNFKYVPPEE